MTPDEFISWLAPVAQRICASYHLFASVCIAQGALESAWGNSRIGEYNIFGRKAVVGDNALLVQTEEYEDGVWETIDAVFKDYDSLEEAVEDWCILITTEPVYSECLNYLDSIERFIAVLAPVYATDPDYAAKLLATIRANVLTVYDE